MTLSQAVQQTVVGEGLAAGCLQIGVTAITTSPLALDSSFRRAWSGFPLAATTFNLIKASMSRNDIQRILRTSSQHKVHVAAWDNEGAWWKPYLVHNYWTAQDVTEHLRESYGIAEEVWPPLAFTFVEALGDLHVQRD